MKKKIIIFGLFLLVVLLITFMTEKSYWNNHNKKTLLNFITNNSKYLKLLNEKEYSALKKELIVDKNALEELNLYFLYRKYINFNSNFSDLYSLIKVDSIRNYNKRLEFLESKKYSKLSWNFWDYISGTEPIYYYLLFKNQEIKSFVNIRIWKKRISIRKDHLKFYSFKYDFNKDNTFLLGSKRLFFRYEKDKYIHCYLEDKSGNIINKVNHTFLENPTVDAIISLKSDENQSYLHLYDFSKRSTKKTFFNKTD